MKGIVLAAIAILMLAANTYATPTWTAIHGEVPQAAGSPTEDSYYLWYHDFCSLWVAYWWGYCNGLFQDHQPVQYGTCFDLADCPGSCRHLNEVWWAVRCLGQYGSFDVEIYCADDHRCPIGEPLAGLYGYSPTNCGWEVFYFYGVELCPCESQPGAGRFIVMITDYTAGEELAPYSDFNALNIEDGCETEWRCQGHSYIYKNVVDYCSIYGEPAALWVSGCGYGCTEGPAVPHGCHLHRGFYAEWLLHCRLNCLGATATEETSWGQLRKLYR